MKIRLLIAVADSNYEKRLSKILGGNSEIHYDITALTKKTSFIESLNKTNYDVVLFEHSMFETSLKFKNGRLFVLLTDDETDFDCFEEFPFIQKIYRYQRISAISKEILEYYSKFLDVKKSQGINSDVNITAIFSPAGGCGKTAVSVAYAMKLANFGDEGGSKKRALYLGLESFSSAHVYFPDTGKSLSDVLSKIDRINAASLMASKQQDPRSGIAYFSMPENYDDMVVITEDHVSQLITAIANADICDELIIDLPSIADGKTAQAFEKADKIFLVTDFTQTARQKLSQFVNQHNIFDGIRHKTVLVINKNGGDKSKIDGIEENIKLPFVNLSDSYAVCENLAKVLQEEMG